MAARLAVIERRLGLVVGLCCSMGAGAANGQGGEIAVGSRVRVTAPEAGFEPLIGTVAGLEPGAVLVRNGSGATTRVPVSPSTTLEVSGGRTSRAGRGAMLGTAVGAMPGLLMTFGDYDSEEGSPGTVAVVGAAAGAVVGGAIGWALKSEQWLPAELPAVSAGIMPLRRGVGFSLRVAWGKGPPSRHPLEP